MLLNCDETGVDNKDFWKGLKFLTSKKALKNTIQTYQKSSKRITFLPFYSAAGHMVCSVWIIGLGKKGKNFHEIQSEMPNINNRTRNLYPKLFIFNDQGYTTKKTWKVTANFLIEVFQNYAENRKVLLTLDRLASHLDVETLEKLLVNGINTLFFSAGTTFALQPADNGFNAAFKRNLQGELVKRRLSSTEVEKDQFVPLLAAAELAGDTVSEKQMRNSFKVTGICPFSEKIIRQRIGMEDEIAEQIEYQNKQRVQKICSDFFDTSFKATSLVKKVAPKQTFRVKKNQSFTSADFIQNSQDLLKEKQDVEQKKLEKQEKKQFLVALNLILQTSFCFNINLLKKEKSSIRRSKKEGPQRSV